MVECDLAKVEVAGSNPVSRSRLFRACSRRWIYLAATLTLWAQPRCRRSKVGMGRSREMGFGRVEAPLVSAAIAGT